MRKRALDEQADRARRTVALLELQATDLRVELLKLQNEIAQARRQFSSLLTVELLEANEQLLVAALHAESIADTASINLSEMTRRAQFDPLTETPNRTLMLDRLNSAIALAHRRGGNLAVLFVDLDHFKDINDTHGHAIGDQALQLAVRRLHSVLRESDTVSRFGGDEFVVLLPEIGHPEDAGISARNMLLALSAPTPVGEVELELHASIGIANFPGDGEDAASLISAADAAMYRAKQKGGRNYVSHHELAANERHLCNAPQTFQ